MEDTGNIVIYESEGGDVRLDVRLENGNVTIKNCFQRPVERNSEIPNFSKRLPTIIIST